MSVNLSPIGNGFQFFSNDGLPLNAGKIYTYQAGSTTPFATYTDSSGLIANTNPIILGTDGRPPSTIWLTDGFFYKFVLTDSSDVTIQTYDNLYGFIGAAPVVAPTAIPSGAIILWRGSIGSIPTGYVLCNGLNGTPDLRDKFVVGAGSSYAVDAEGGSADAVIVSHNHGGSGIVTDPGHAHEVFSIGRGQITGAVLFDTKTATSTAVMEDVGGSNLEGNNGVSLETTGITVGISSQGVDGSGKNLPPYYALCYIMKT